CKRFTPPVWLDRRLNFSFHEISFRLKSAIKGRKDHAKMMSMNQQKAATTFGKLAKSVINPMPNSTRPKYLKKVGRC
ncbi:hypothetical protein ABTC62_19455, partial [Acinetobacter baumannii]